MDIHLRQAETYRILKLNNQHDLTYIKKLIVALIRDNHRNNLNIEQDYQLINNNNN